jgi:hypothetical protein
MSRYPKAYIDYLVYFHAARDYFECHEILEEFWKANKDSDLSPAYVGLIQVAVALYHQRRGNLEGALKMLASARRLLTEERLQALGVDALRFRQALDERYGQLADGRIREYRDLNIPLADEKLLLACKERCAERGEKWGSPSNLDNRYLIHKHTLRDRSDVISKRAEQLKMRQKRGNSDSFRKDTGH